MLQLLQGVMDAEVWEQNILPHQMNSILVEVWYGFKAYPGNTIRERISKTNILPLIPSNLSTNTQEYVSSVPVFLVPMLKRSIL